MTEIETLCIAALRYALPRSTYIVSEVCDIVFNHKDDLSSSALEIIRKDIERELLERMKSKHSFECDELAIKKLYKNLFNATITPLTCCGDDGESC